jgi:8-oxo-dGTP pyrophosphatase MutT (NUDIX family)
MSRYGTTPGRPEEYRQGNERAVKPKDAATLIIVRQGDEPRLLLGKRSMKHKFMPGKFVFPGGRLDLIDQRLKLPNELPSPVMQRLRKLTQRQVTDAKLKGLALAAVRETFEETGLVVGTPTSESIRTSNTGWQDYFSRGVLPPLESMDFIARAITPPYRTRRFDTRFFMVFDDVIHSDPSALGSATGELLDLHWLTLSEARETDLPAITRMVIDIVEERLAHTREAQLKQPAPFVRSLHKQWVTEEL